MDDDRNYQPAAEPVALNGDSPGALIRAARERNRLSQEDLASATRLPLATIRALEADTTAALTEPVYIRGYFRKCAQTLGIPVERLLALYTPGSGPQLTRAKMPLTLASNVGEPRAAGSQWPLLIATVVIVVGVAIWYFMGQQHLPLSSLSLNMSETAPTETSAQQPAPSSAPSSGLAPSTSRGIDLAPQQPLADRAPPPAEPAAAGWPTVTPMPPGQIAAPDRTPAQQSGQTSAAAVSLPPPATGATRLSLAVRHASWARVEDANGRVLINRVLQSGERPEFSGQAPYSVVLGYAPGVELQYDGQPVDISAYVSASSTARFTVPAAR